MAPFPRVNKAVLVKILTYREGEGLMLAAKLKEKQIQGFSKWITNVSPQSVGSHTAH